MQIGIDSFAAAISDLATGLTLSPLERMHNLLQEIELADRVGLDVFGIGEHHSAEFLAYRLQPEVFLPEVRGIKLPL
jgi:alkanesulfonate monooxygenase SsuD/methylene tetrahydromethanopterin reductase-like flavin-dependent oxidoreductase (luciferase family)